MQRLDEATRAEREVENNALVARVCQQNDIPKHPRNHCTQCSSASTKSSDVVSCKRCRHYLADGLHECPHCHGEPTKPTRAGEHGKMLMLEGLEKVTQSLLRMCCCMFKGGGGVGSGYIIPKGAAEYVSADFDAPSVESPLTQLKPRTYAQKRSTPMSNGCLYTVLWSLGISRCGTRTGTSSVSRPRELTTTPSLPAFLPSPARRAGPAIHVPTSKG